MTITISALQNESQAWEHLQYFVVLYGKHKHVDKEKGKQEVDKVDNQIS